VPPDAHLVPDGGDHAVAVGEHRAAAEKLDVPAADPQAPQPSERLGRGSLGVREDRVGEPEALGPGAVARDRVGIDAGDLDPGLLVFGMVLAKLAKLAQSARGAVQDVEEQDQRSRADELSQPIVRTARVGKREIGEGSAGEVGARGGGRHARQGSRLGRPGRRTRPRSARAMLDPLRGSP
jgi:hypothetical protein